MDKQKKGEILNTVSLASFICCLVLAIIAFFVDHVMMWLFVAGISLLLAVMKFADGLKAYKCDGEDIRGRRDTVSGIVFAVLAVILLFVFLKG
ncbi:MAG: hypothetical protein RSC43_03355 [Clostridia bacterium]